MTTPLIRPPWVCPLAVIDPYICYAWAGGLPNDARVFASTRSTLLPVGTASNHWHASCAGLPYEDINDPIVSYALFANANERISWQPILLSHLPAWLAQMRESRLDPTLKGLPGTQRTLGQLSNSTSTFWQLIRHPHSGAIELGSAQRQLREHLLVTGHNNFRDDRYRPFTFRADQERTEATLSTTSRANWRGLRHHSAKPPQFFYGKRPATGRSNDSVLYCGVELEMELSSASVRQRMMRALYCAADKLSPLTCNLERLHIEQDSSLPHAGIECVLMPHEIGSAHSEEFWQLMWQTACRAGADNSGGTAGMHIHVSSVPALRPIAPESDLSRALQRELISYHIDLVAAVLCGGKTFNPFTREVPRGAIPARPITNAFGRPDDWCTSSNQRNHFAAPDFTVDRKLPGGPYNRYRHVNWCNRETIEFRFFGPFGFNEQDQPDWINAATQLAAGIVAFARQQALCTLESGLRADSDSEEYLARLPLWIKRHLHVAEARSSVVRTWDGHALTLLNQQTGRGLFLPGTSPMTRESYGSSRTEGACSINRVTESMRDLWPLFLEFLQDDPCAYAEALVHLDKHVVPHVLSRTTDAPAPLIPPNVTQADVFETQIADRPIGVIRGRTATEVQIDDTGRETMARWARNQMSQLEQSIARYPLPGINSIL